MKKFLSKLKIKYIFNATYCPEFNPIEGVIGLTKDKIKRHRLKDLVEGHDSDLHALIPTAFSNVKKGAIRNLIKRSNRLLNCVK